MANKMKIHQQDCPNNQKQNPISNVHQGPSTQNSQAKNQNKKTNRKNNSGNHESNGFH